MTRAIRPVDPRGTPRAPSCHTSQATTRPAAPNVERDAAPEAQPSPA